TEERDEPHQRADRQYATRQKDRHDTADERERHVGHDEDQAPRVPERQRQEEEDANTRQHGAEEELSSRRRLSRRRSAHVGIDAARKPQDRETVLQIRGV